MGKGFGVTKQNLRSCTINLYFTRDATSRALREFSRCITLTFEFHFQLKWSDLTLWQCCQKQFFKSTSERAFDERNKLASSLIESNEHFERRFNWIEFMRNQSSQERSNDIDLKLRNRITYLIVSKLARPSGLQIATILRNLSLSIWRFRMRKLSVYLRNEFMSPLRFHRGDSFVRNSVLTTFKCQNGRGHKELIPLSFKGRHPEHELAHSLFITLSMSFHVTSIVID